MSQIDLTTVKDILQKRFAKHALRHPDIEWTDVWRALEAAPDKLVSLQKMEASGGEPDVVGYDKKINAYIFFDCSAETPKGRRSLCYDAEALAARKEAKPAGSAVQQALEMGVELLTEEQYRYLQTLGEFDLKTSSWLRTPDAVRSLGGAIFGDRRFGRVFVYHNGVQSYYGGRGFRCALMLPSNR